MVKRLRLDATTVCQLRCPLCPTGQRQHGIGWGHLRFKNFRTLLESTPSLQELELSNWGEVFLNPELIPILRLAHERGVRLKADNGANFNHCPDATLEALVQYQFRSLRVALDGASQQTYALYRIGGSFETVIENIRKLNSLKRRFQSQYPRLTWQFVVFGHNEHELPLARAMAEALDMEFDVRLSWDGKWSPVRNTDFIRRETGLEAASREEFKERKRTRYFRPCRDLWAQPVVNWDGRLLGCCFNFGLGDFGNVFEAGLGPLMNSERYRHAQKMVTGSATEREDIPCTRCAIYREMKQDGDWVQMPVRRDE